jgi:hypothetical protein
VTALEIIASLVMVVLALLAGGGIIIAPLVTRVNTIDTRIEALGAGGKLLTDYKESTIEKLTRAEEKLRALDAQVIADKLIFAVQVKDLDDKMNHEIAGQGAARMEQVANLDAAITKLDARLLILTEDGRAQLAMIVALQAKMDILMKERDAATALGDSQRQRQFDKP